MKENTQNKRLALSNLAKRARKNKKHFQYIYLSAIPLILLSVFSFLLFGPFTVPVFSDIGERIVNRIKFEDKEDVKILEIEQENEEEQEQELELEEIIKEEEQEEIINEPVVKTPLIISPEPVPTPNPEYLCTDEEIAELRDRIKTGEAYVQNVETQLEPVIQTCINECMHRNTYEYCKEKCTLDFVCYIPSAYNPMLCSELKASRKALADIQIALENCLSDR